VQQEQLEAKLDRGIAFMEQAECYLDLAAKIFNLKRRPSRESVKAFDEVRKGGSLVNSCQPHAGGLVDARYPRKPGSRPGQ